MKADGATGSTVLATVARASRLVVKVGSTLVTNEGRGLDHDAVGRWASQIAALAQAGKSVILVSSGAIAEGMQRLGWSTRPRAIHDLQAAAAVGQMGLVQAYERAFAGDIRNLRPMGPSALAAADAAARSNDPTHAKQFLDIAARDPSCRIDARRRAVALRLAAEGVAVEAGHVHVGDQERRLDVTQAGTGRAAVAQELDS